MPRFVFLALFVGFPVGELYLLLRVAAAIGALATVLLLILGAFAGMAVMRYHGMASLQRLRSALGGGELPARPLLEALLAQLAGGLLILPGFISDGVGLCLLIGPVRRWLAACIVARSRPVASTQIHIIEGEFRRRNDPP